MSPDPRVKRGGADKTKHVPYFIFLIPYFLYSEPTAKGSPVLTKSVLSFRFQQVIKKFAVEMLSLTHDIFKRSETT